MVTGEKITCAITFAQTIHTLMFGLLFVNKWDNLLKSRGCSLVNLFPREVSRVLNLFLRELIKGTLKDFPKANPKPNQRPDPKPKTRGATGS